MAENSGQERTEQATPHRLEQAREKGQIAYSSDFSGGLVLLITVLTLLATGDFMLSKLGKVLIDVLSSIHVVANDKASLEDLSMGPLKDCFLICIPVVLVAFLSTLLVGGLITGMRFSSKAIHLDLSKLNPISGFSKLFSAKAVVRGGMALFKVALVGTLVFLLVYSQFKDHQLENTVSIEHLVERVKDLTLLLLIWVSVGLALLGIADFAFQKWKFANEMKMSRQDVQDERKDEEGDPLIRARLKRLQREISQRSLVADVASATVVVTNPTHFAVCLKYDRSTPAPIVVAKGHDVLAFRIIEIAKDNGVVVLERKPLARALYASVEVGAEIPVELFQAVAEVLTFIQSLDRQIG